MKKLSPGNNNPRARRNISLGFGEWLLLTVLHPEVKGGYLMGVEDIWEIPGRRKLMEKKSMAILPIKAPILT